MGALTAHRRQLVQGLPIAVLSLFNGLEQNEGNGVTPKPAPLVSKCARPDFQNSSLIGINPSNMRNLHRRFERFQRVPTTFPSHPIWPAWQLRNGAKSRAHHAASWPGLSRPSTRSRCNKHCRIGAPGGRIFPLTSPKLLLFYILPRWATNPQADCWSMTAWMAGTSPARTAKGVPDIA